jgi:hypothetical protein
MPAGDDPATALRRLGTWAARRKAIPILFGIEPADLPFLQGWEIREVGRQPLFQAGPEYRPELSGKGQPKDGRELRRQARRATSKGADWTEVDSGDIWELHEKGALERLLLTRWDRQPLAEFSFQVALHLAAGQRHRRYFLLQTGDLEQPLGLAILLRSDRGWLLEHQIVDRRAPNGSGELLVCRLLASALDPGERLSLGITPLYRALVPDLPHQEVPGILSFLPAWLRNGLLAVWEPLYGFRRLQSYREKLQPPEWEPVYWAHRGALPVSALLAVLRVFAGGSLGGFALATGEKILAKASRRIPAKVLRGVNAFFFWSLLIWIPILWNLDGELIFQAPVAPKLWAIFDVLLAILFARHGVELRRIDRRSGVRRFLLGLVTADALLSLIWTALVHQWPSPGTALGLFLVALNGAPCAAVVFLLACGLRRPDFLRHGGRRGELENP